MVVICVNKLNAKYIMPADASQVEVALVKAWHRNHDIESVRGILRNIQDELENEFHGFDIKIKNIHKIRFLNKSDKNNYKVIHSSDTCVVNRDNSMQQAQTTGYKNTVTNTKTVTITNTGEMSGTVPIPKIPLTLKFIHSESTTEMESEAIEISAPPQKVDMEPHSKKSVSYTLKTYDEAYNYLLDFEIDESSTFAFTHNYYKHHLPLISVFGGDLVLRNWDSDGISFSDDGKFILRNYPMKYRVTNARIFIVYGAPVKLSSSDLSVSSDDEIEC